jgi:transposase
VREICCLFRTQRSLLEDERGAKQCKWLDLRCAGLDVQKRTVVVCVLLTQPDGAVQREVRTFSTMTVELIALGDWLESLQVPVVALESTGVYWQPVFNLLEDGRTIILVNPQHRKRGART